VEDWSTKRKEWSTARDKMGGKQGAVKGVSLGDELDKVGKAQKVGYTTFSAALKKLQQVVTKYLAALPKGSDKVKAWIKANIEAKADADLATSAADLKALAWVQTELIDDVVAPINGGHPDSAYVSRIEAHLKKNPGMDWATAAKALGTFTIPTKVVEINIKRLAAMGKVALKGALPGHQAHYKAYSAYEAPFRSDIVFYSKWVKAATADEFLGFMKASRERSDSVEAMTGLKAAVSALKA
jgi:hypothetical protein